MTGLLSAASERGSRGEGRRRPPVSYYLSGPIRNNQGPVKGKVIVIKRRGPASGSPDVAVHIKEQEAAAAAFIGEQAGGPANAIKDLDRQRGGGSLCGSIWRMPGGTTL